jgi:FixJ family two-component response regulator
LICYVALDVRMPHLAGRMLRAQFLSRGARQKVQFGFAEMMCSRVR